MRKRFIVSRVLLMSMSILVMAAGPVIAGCSRTCADVGPCCEAKPKETEACCTQDAPAEDHTPGRQDLCDCDHGPEGPMAMVPNVSGPSLDGVEGDIVARAIVLSPSWGLHGKVRDETRAPPPQSVFLLACAFLI